MKCHYELMEWHHHHPGKTIAMTPSKELLETRVSETLERKEKNIGHGFSYRKASVRKKTRIKINLTPLSILWVLHETYTISQYNQQKIPPPCEQSTSSSPTTSFWLFKSASQ